MIRANVFQQAGPDNPRFCAIDYGYVLDHSEYEARSLLKLLSESGIITESGTYLVSLPEADSGEEPTIYQFEITIGMVIH